MRAGTLRHRIEIQQQASGQDAHGGPSGSWSTILTLWAAVEPLRGRELEESQRELTTVDTRIRVRYQGAAITTDNRAVWDGHIYDIHSVINPSHRDKQLVLMCSEVTKQ